MSDLQENEAEDILAVKKRARRRLVGAAVLALLAIIILPVIMDRGPQPSNDGIQVLIPERMAPNEKPKVVGDGKEESAELPSKELVQEKSGSETAAASVTAAVIEEAKKSAATESAKTVQPETNTSLSPTADEVAPSSIRPEENKSSAKLPVTAKPAQPHLNAASQLTHNVVGSPSKAADNNQPPHKASNTASQKTTIVSKENKTSKANGSRVAASKAATEPARNGNWILRLGAYKDESNVKRLLKIGKSAGVPIYAEPFETPNGQRTRVRVGPYATKANAESARQLLQKHCVEATVAEK